MTNPTASAAETGNVSPAAATDPATIRESLEGESLTALRKQAGELNIEGRTKLERDDLVTAIVDARIASSDDVRPGTEDEVGRPPAAEVAQERAEARQHGRVLPGTDGARGADVPDDEPTG